MAEMQQTYVTQEFLEKMKKELEYLKSTKRLEVAQRLKEAIALGDLSENSEYVDAKNEQAFTEGKILELEAKIRTAVVIEAGKSDHVTMASSVKIKDLQTNEEVDVTIVGSSKPIPSTARSPMNPRGPRAHRRQAGRRGGSQCACGHPEISGYGDQIRKRTDNMEEKKNVQKKPAENLNDQMLIRREKLQQIRDLGYAPFGQRFEWDHHAADIRNNAEALEASEEHVRIAGRIMIIRNHGKTAFCVLRDRTGDIQLYVRRDQVSETEWKIFKLLDIGDIIGLEGNVFTTHTGEVTVRVLTFTILSKSLRPLPEKWHGLTDKEQRYRQRYVDLIVNPGVRETFEKRAKVINTVRQWLTERGFLEVETPMLQALYGGANARPFTTHLNALDMPLYLRIAPELYLKRLIVGGFERVFEMNRNFRNEGMDNRHNPEFTSLKPTRPTGIWKTSSRKRKTSSPPAQKKSAAA